MGLPCLNRDDLTWLELAKFLLLDFAMCKLWETIINTKSRGLNCSGHRRLDDNDYLNKIGVKQTDSHTLCSETQF